MKFTYLHRGQIHSVELTLGKAGREEDTGNAIKVVNGKQTWIHHQGKSYLLERIAAENSFAHKAGGEMRLRSPMPGQVRQVSTNAGQSVKAGETILVLEAMKMEIRVQAPRDAKIATIHVTAGQSVDRDQLLVELEAL